MSFASMIDVLEARQLFSAAPVVMGYLPDYASNSAAVIASLQSHNWEGLTQINYFSVNPNSAGNLPGTGTNASTLTTSGFNIGKTSATTSALGSLVTKAHASGVKVDIVVGGGGSLSNALTTFLTPRKNSSGQLTPAADAAAFATFATSVQTFCNNHHVDGVDLDWEPDGPTSAQINNYAALIHKLRSSATGLALSAAVNSEPLWLAPNYDSTSYILTPQAMKDLDHVNVMTYDLNNPGDGAPIATAEQNLSAWGKYATANGVATSKLNFGLPFYGSATTLTSAQMPADNPWMNVTDDNTSSATFAQLVKAKGLANVPTTGSGNLVFSNLSIAGTFNGKNSAAKWNFDGRGTITAKTNYALANHFGGVMAWDLSGDYFNGGQYDDAHSLLPAIRQAVAAFNAASTPTASKLTGKVIGTAGSHNNSGNTGAKVFDGSLSTYFDAPTAGSSTSPVWVGLDLGAARKLTQLKFAARSGYEYRMEGGIFQASNSADFSTGTVNLYTVGNTSAPSSTSLTTINLSVNGTYRYIRFLAPAQSYCNIAEMQVFGV